MNLVAYNPCLVYFSFLFFKLCQTTFCIFLRSYITVNIDPPKNKKNRNDNNNFVYTFVCMNVKSRTKKILCLIYNGVCQIINYIIAHFPPPATKKQKKNQNTNQISAI